MEAIEGETQGASIDDEQALAGVLIGAEWPPHIEAVVVPRAEGQHAGLCRLFDSESISLVKCGFGIWVCTAVAGADMRPNLVAGPVARAMRSTFDGELYGPAVFLATRTEGSSRLAPLNDAQRSLVVRAYAVAVTDLMGRAETDEQLRRKLGAAGGKR